MQRSHVSRAVAAASFSDLSIEVARLVIRRYLRYDEEYRSVRSWWKVSALCKPSAVPTENAIEPDICHIDRTLRHIALQEHYRSSRIQLVIDHFDAHSLYHAAKALSELNESPEGGPQSVDIFILGCGTHWTLSNIVRWVAFFQAYASQLTGTVYFEGLWCRAHHYDDLKNREMLLRRLAILGLKASMIADNAAIASELISIAKHSDLRREDLRCQGLVDQLDETPTKLLLERTMNLLSLSGPGGAGQSWYRSCREDLANDCMIYYNEATRISILEATEPPTPDAVPDSGSDEDDYDEPDPDQNGGAEHTDTSKDQASVAYSRNYRDPWWEVGREEETCDDKNTVRRV